MYARKISWVICTFIVILLYQAALYTIMNYYGDVCNTISNHLGNHKTFQAMQLLTSGMLRLLKRIYSLQWNV